MVLWREPPGKLFRKALKVSFFIANTAVMSHKSCRAKVFNWIYMYIVIWMVKVRNTELMWCSYYNYISVRYSARYLRCSQADGNGWTESPLSPPRLLLSQLSDIFRFSWFILLLHLLHPPPPQAGWWCNVLIDSWHPSIIYFYQKLNNDVRLDGKGQVISISM